MKRMTKTAQRARASKQAKNRGIVKAVRSLLKKTNPSVRISGAKMVRLKGGVLKITPIKANPTDARFIVEWKEKRLKRWQKLFRVPVDKYQARSRGGELKDQGFDVRYKVVGRGRK